MTELDALDKEEAISNVSLLLLQVGETQWALNEPQTNLRSEVRVRSLGFSIPQEGDT